MSIFLCDRIRIMMNETPTPTDRLSKLGAFSDPIRRSLFEFVTNCREPVTRAEAATALKISRNLAAYHLDQLVESGFLTFVYAHPEGHGGPGSGRPAKRYTRAEDVLSISIPPRSFGMLANLFVQAMSADESGAVQSRLNELAKDEGKRASSKVVETTEGLVTLGYEPSVTTDGDIVMHNCPFHEAMEHDPQLVCALNHHLLQGFLEARGEDPNKAELSPCSGRCCVVIHPDIAKK